MLAFLAGCATSPKPQTDAEYKQSMTHATQTLAGKGNDQAVAEFQEIALLNPSRGEPWSYIAKIRFDEQKYGEAIVAADEALNRDPEDFTAKTVRAVGGLRVAMQSLADLRANALLAGNARTDAVALAAAMRETLGQDVLFPEGYKPPRPRQPRRTDAQGAGAAPAQQAKPAANAAATSPASPAATSAAPPAAKPATATPSTAPAAAGAAPSGRAPDPFGNLLKP
ncbi:tetratricopeptide repeat protein [Achromobacter aegrifaciens]